MKHVIISLLIALFFPLLIIAQTKPKQDKPPTKKEMDDMMKEMQKAMDEIDPETKRMMDSMGIKIDTKKMAKDASVANDKDLAKAWEDETRIVPKRDDVRIAAIPKKVTAANMGSFLAALQKKIAALLPPDVISTGEKSYNFIQANSKNSSEAGNMAAAFWIANKQELTIFLMGKICTLDPSNTDNLSNYASMLSMMGAQHLAIPILNILNKKFPKNSTLLNNLGQAWFGLGEILKAEKYLDSAIRIYAYHPQANLTKAAIEESRGNITKATDHLKKSIKYAYTSEKEDMLRKHGYKIKLQDLRVPFKPGPDPLGLGSFKRPDYPTSLSELRSLKPVWENFTKECEDRIAKLQNEYQAAAEAYAKSLTSFKTGFVSLPLHIKKASLQLDKIKDDYEIKFKRLGEKFIVLGEDLNRISKEHKRAAPEAPCEAHQAAEDDFIKKYNERKKAYDEEFLQVVRHYSNDLAYWSQFTSTDKKQFDMIVVGFQIGWLEKLKEYKPLLYSEFENLVCAKKEDAKPGELSEFDVVACNYNDTMDLKVITFYNNCSRMTSKLNLKFVEYTRYDNFNNAEGDTYMSSSIKISVEKGFDKLKIEEGPIKVEGKVGAAIEMEFDRSGLKDVNLSVEAKAGLGHNLFDGKTEIDGNIGGKDVIDNTVEVGLEGRISIMSGKGSVKGTGKFDKITFAEW